MRRALHRQKRVLSRRGKAQTRVFETREWSFLQLICRWPSQGSGRTRHIQNDSRSRRKLEPWTGTGSTCSTESTCSGTDSIKLSEDVNDQLVGYLEVVSIGTILSILGCFLPKGTCYMILIQSTVLDTKQQWVRNEVEFQERSWQMHRSGSSIDGSFSLRMNWELLLLCKLLPLSFYVWCFNRTLSVYDVTAWGG